MNLRDRGVLRKIIVVGFLVLFLLGIYFFVGKPMIAFVGDLEAFQDYVEQKGIMGICVLGIFIFLQTVSNCIPGLPFYLAAGFVFGGLKGALLCDLFAMLGNTAAFLIGRKFGRSFLLFLFPEKKLEHVEELILNKKPVLVHFLFMFLPLPKDTYAWLGFYSRENVVEWMIITFIARFPHIFIYTYGAEKMLDNQYGYIVAGAVIATLVYLVMAVYLKRQKNNNKAGDEK